MYPYEDFYIECETNDGFVGIQIDWLIDWLIDLFQTSKINHYKTKQMLQCSHVREIKTKKWHLQQQQQH